MPFNATFDASQFEPNQGGGAIHPPGTFDCMITNTSVDPTKDGTGGMFVVEISTPAGSSVRRFNLWNQSAKAVEIAHGQLSALCRAVGIFQVDFKNDGAALRNARCKVVIDYQIDKETKQPTQYTEIKKFLDLAGNEPGKAPAQPQTVQQAQPQPGNQPMTAQPGGGWGSQPSNPNPNPAPSNGFGGGNPNPAPANQNGAWKPGGEATGTNPPWGAR